MLAGGMLAVYLLTLQHRVSPESLASVANACGLNWRPELFGPVTCLVTWPFRGLPATWIPVALNLLSAVAATLSLAWLARSVVLLPHDRTGPQRLRQPGKLPLLAIREAWLPPLLAVLACGLQTTFWDHSVVATGEMINLAMFAWLIRCLLELRAGRNTVWLSRFAPVLGLAVANNWAMVPFAPLLALGAVWAARANPFELPFLERVVEGFGAPGPPLTTRLHQALQPLNPRRLAGLAVTFGLGLSLILLPPALASWSTTSQTRFWPALHLVLRTYKTMLLNWPPSSILILCLPALLPALFMTFRWSRLVGGARGAAQLVSGTFHFIHAFFLTMCLWIAMDFPLSPRRLIAGVPCLPLYFVAALGTGYYAGYLLLVFGTDPVAEAQRPTPRWRRWLRRCPVAAVWTALLALAIGLPLKNLPQVLQQRHGPMAIYAANLDRCLPPPGAVVLSDNPFHLFCFETTLIRRGLQNAYLGVDTSALAHDAGYFEFLRRRHPGFNLSLLLPRGASDLADPTALASWVVGLAAARPVYCLKPVSGFLGETFTVQPRALFYQLILRSTNAIGDPRLPSQGLAENLAFWHDFASNSLPELARRAHPPERPRASGRWGRLRQSAFSVSDPDPWWAVFSAWCALDLDVWGVELQRAGRLAEAGDCFEWALQLNPDSAAAGINRQFNQDLQARKPAHIESPERTQTRLGKRRSWNQVLTVDGPVDEPNSCYCLGVMFAEAAFPRQAIREFARAQTLAPGYAETTLRLADQFLNLADYPNALAEANRALQLSPRNPDGLFLKGFSLFELTNYSEALPVLTKLLTIDPDQQRARLARAWVCLKAGDLNAAHRDFELASQSPTNAYYGWYGLAEIAGRRQDNAAVAKYAELFLSHAPTNLPSGDQFKARLAQLLKASGPSGKP